MKKTTLLAILVAGVLLLPTLSMAQLTASGPLGVTATVQSSINMVFNSAAGGVALGGAGTNAATLDFGTISAYGLPLAAGVTRTVGANSFTVSSPFNVHVDANGSPTYRLTAQLNAADLVNTWAMTGFGGVTNAAPTGLGNANAYGVDTTYTLSLTVPFSAGAGAINNTINFVATAN